MMLSRAMRPQPLVAAASLLLAITLLAASELGARGLGDSLLITRRGVVRVQLSALAGPARLFTVGNHIWLAGTSPYSSANYRRIPRDEMVPCVAELVTVQEGGRVLWDLWIPYYCLIAVAGMPACAIVAFRLMRSLRASRRRMGFETLKT